MKKLALKQLIFVAFLTVVFCACNKPNTKAEGADGPPLSISVATQTQPSVSHPWPIDIEGVIENYDKIPAKTRNDLHLYVIQRNQGGTVYYIQPEFVVDSSGKFSGQIWLGEEKKGNNQTFEVNYVLTTSKLHLIQNDANPVSGIPQPNYYTQKFIMKRVDR
jgi:hypothetical protein